MSKKFIKLRNERLGRKTGDPRRPNLNPMINAHKTKDLAHPGEKVVGVGAEAKTVKFFKRGTVAGQRLKVQNYKAQHRPITSKTVRHRSQYDYYETESAKKAKMTQEAGIETAQKIHTHETKEALRQNIEHKSQ